MSNARTTEVAQHIRGEINIEGGIVSGRLADLAEVLNTTPEGILGSMRQAGIEPMVDTARDKGRSRNAGERPTNPELRSLAFPVRDLRKVAAVLGAEEALNGEALEGAPVPA